MDVLIDDFEKIHIKLFNMTGKWKINTFEDYIVIIEPDKKTINKYNVVITDCSKHYHKIKMTVHTNKKITIIFNGSDICNCCEYMREGNIIIENKMQFVHFDNSYSWFRDN